MGGRKCNYDKHELIEVLKLFRTEILNAFGKSTDPLWDRICFHFGNKIKPTALYTIIKCNRLNCHDILGISGKADSENDEDDDVLSFTSLTENNDDNDEKMFVINNHVWLSLLSPDDNYSMKTDWTHTMFEILSTQLETNCIWMFKRHSLNLSTSGCYFNCQGYCKECNATIDLRCINKPKSNEPVRFSYKLNDVNEKKHSNIMKRPLSGIERNNVSKRLCDGKMAVNWRREHVSENSNNRKLYSLDVLRKSRQEYKDKTQFKEISSEKNVLVSLLCLKYEEKYCSSIHKIGLDPFYIFYWTPSQTIIFNDYIRKQKRSKLYIDATGTLCKKIERPNNNISGHIFLYQGVIHTGTRSGQIPITQMLSECHNINQINYWLSDWIRYAKIPNIIICDHSLALLGGVSRSIAGEVSLKSYMDKSFSIVSMKSNYTLKTFIRVDYAHVMKFVSNWSCFKGTNIDVKKFYLKLISRIVMCTTLKNAEIVIKNVLITSNSLYEGYNDYNTPSESEKSKILLKKQIAGIDEIEIEDEEDDSIPQELDEETIIIIEDV